MITPVKLTNLAKQFYYHCWYNYNFCGNSYISYIDFILFIEATIKDMKPVNYNPWPGYKFTGVLRPWPKVKHSLTLTFR